MENPLNKFQKDENPLEFFNKREIRLKEIQEKTNELLEEIDKEQSRNAEIVLYVIPLEESLITLNDSFLENFYLLNTESISDNPDLFLQEVQIIYHEYLDELGIEIYQTIRIRYKLNHENLIAETDFQLVEFRDDLLMIFHPGLIAQPSPIFASEEKYSFAKGILKQIRQELDFIWKKDEKK